MGWASRHSFFSTFKHCLSRIFRRIGPSRGLCDEVVRSRSTCFYVKPSNVPDVETHASEAQLTAVLTSATAFDKITENFCCKCQTSARRRLYIPFSLFITGAQLALLERLSGMMTNDNNYQSRQRRIVDKFSCFHYRY